MAIETCHTCKDCKTKIFADVNMVMVKDDLWLKICDDAEDVICDKCMEIRLERPITKDDFKKPSFGKQKIILCNKWWLNNKI